jgi:Uma2 family endonuclease
VDAAVKKHLFTVGEYHRMGEAGIFGEDDRVELIDGEVFEMSPIGWRHTWTVTRLTDLLGELRTNLGLQYSVSVRNPITLSLHGETQPDLVLVRDLPVGRLPRPEDALLAVEVADTSLEYDRERKLPLYARAGIPEVWSLEPQSDTVEVHPEPGHDGYHALAHHRRGERVASATISGSPSTLRRCCLHRRPDALE